MSSLPLLLVLLFSTHIGEARILMDSHIGVMKGLDHAKKIAGKMEGRLMVKSADTILVKLKEEPTVHRKQRSGSGNGKIEVHQTMKNRRNSFIAGTESESFLLQSHKVKGEPNELKGLQKTYKHRVGKKGARESTEPDILALDYPQTHRKPPINNKAP